jgi:hypothetical protein
MFALLTPEFWFGFLAGLGAVATAGVAGALIFVWWIIRHEPDPGDDK